MEKELNAYKKYLERTGFAPAPVTTALIDMDGVLYNSMPNHSEAWKRLSKDMGWEYKENEFFLNEGMTGAAIIRQIVLRNTGVEHVSDEEAKRLYDIKAKYFNELPKVEPMKDTDKVLDVLRRNNVTRVLVTGSGQNSLLQRLDNDYPGMFLPNLRVTAYDVKKGKPDPEPYLMGLEKAGAEAASTIVIENAPLGAQAGHAANCFTVAVTTGPVPEEALYDHGADIVYPKMAAFAEALPTLIALRNEYK